MNAPSPGEPEELRSLTAFPQHDGYSTGDSNVDGNQYYQHQHTTSNNINISTIDAILYQPRLDALLECDANIISYNPFSFTMVFRLRGRNFGMIGIPLLCLLLWDVCWTVMLKDPSTSLAMKITHSLDGLISPLLTPVSFLLVFRLGKYN